VPCPKDFFKDQASSMVLMRGMKPIPRALVVMCGSVLRWSRLTSLACPNYPNCKAPLHLPKRPQRVLGSSRHRHRLRRCDVIARLPIHVGGVGTEIFRENFRATG
jgi:hypothetical protein